MANEYGLCDDCVNEGNDDVCLDCIPKNFEPKPLTGNETPEQLYEKGEQFSDTYDEENAFNCFLKASEQGHAQAMIQVGLRYKDGLGIKKDKEKGKYWLEKAIENGETHAEEYL